MDLRAVLTTDAQREEASRVLNYQPFIISDDIQTGAAYSWTNGGDPRARPRFVFRRREENEESWAKITDANARLRRMYDDFVAEIARRYPGGSLLDFACNNGYFPVRASMLGMRGLGADGDRQHGGSIAFLNRHLGTTARFEPRNYDPRLRGARRVSNLRPWPASLPRADVVCLVAILCHVPDPLGFLTFAAGLADKALFFMGQVLDSDHFLISYQKPHRALSKPTRFPFTFNDNTRLSRGLLFHTLEELGFRDVIELSWQPAWLPQRFGHFSVAEPDDAAARLDYDLRFGSRHVAVLAMR
jgi:Methyltransferase domain